MKWPFAHRGETLASEGKELAKSQSQLEIAKVIESESSETAHEHRWLLYRNHFGPNVARAFRQGKRP